MAAIRGLFAYGISVPLWFVPIVIQAPKLAYTLLWGSYFIKERLPRENPKWRPFPRWRLFADSLVHLWFFLLYPVFRIPKLFVTFLTTEN